MPGSSSNTWRATRARPWPSSRVPSAGRPHGGRYDLHVDPESFILASSQCGVEVEFGTTHIYAGATRANTKTPELEENKPQPPGRMKRLPDSRLTRHLRTRSRNLAPLATPQ